jgi:uncharacterized protein (TIGR00255 family)
MPRSMTGYGHAEYKDSNYDISIEVRNLNNRFLDVNLKLPRSLSAFEFAFKDQIKKKMFRGKLTINITLKDLTADKYNFVLNEENISFYHDVLKQIQQQIGLNESLKLDHFLQFKDLIEPQETGFVNEECITKVQEIMNIALDRLNEMREREGENIGSDIIQRLKTIEKLVDEIEKRGKENPQLELQRLHERVENLLADKEINHDRLEMELALLADKVDITEECIRLKSHINLFYQVYQNQQEMGKKLNFILQEMQRESNTIGSKTTDIKVSHQNIKIKEEIEKIREQVQNIE